MAHHPQSQQPGGAEAAADGSQQRQPLVDRPRGCRATVVPQDGGEGLVRLELPCGHWQSPSLLLVMMLQLALATWGVCYAAALALRSGRLDGLVVAVPLLPLGALFGMLTASFGAVAFRWGG